MGGVDPHHRCLTVYWDTDLHDIPFIVDCTLTHMHRGDHLGKDPQGVLFRWPNGRIDWEER